MERKDYLALGIFAVLVVLPTLALVIVIDKMPRKEMQQVTVTTPATASVTKYEQIPDWAIPLRTYTLVDNVINVLTLQLVQQDPWQDVTPPISIQNKSNPRVTGEVFATNGNFTLLIMDERNYRSWKSTGQAQTLS